MEKEYIINKARRFCGYIVGFVFYISGVLKLLDPVLDSYAAVPGSLITILQNTQEIYGYIPVDAVYYISGRTGLSPAKIMGVATFYSQFRFKAVGKYLILLCKGTACTEQQTN